ncbi:MAG: helix-turn-helix transcriptional regulator [Campylobacterota bacterium]|nr:helix-turn-helix transcriptional regulator [Campylobacterota bacterium]
MTKNVWFINLWFYKTIKKQNITQMQLALAINHNSVGHIAKAELNKFDKHFSLQNLYKISKVLKIDICELIK